MSVWPAGSGAHGWCHEQSMSHAVLWDTAVSGGVFKGSLQGGESERGSGMFRAGGCWGGRCCPKREDAQPTQRWGVSLDRRGGGESGRRTQPLGSPAFLTASLVLCARQGSLHLPKYSHRAHVTPPTPSTLPWTHTHTPHMTQTQRHVTPHHRHLTPRHAHLT